MVEPKSKIESIREWVVDHKLRTVGNFLLLQFSHGFLPRKFVLGLHAQALTLAALAGAAAVEYYDHRNRTEPDPYAKFLPVNGYSRKE
ncbi:hypothetical protein V6N12_023657 [Hibiscus sabdariffa]|uniref:HIG1 domain-containing protein n=1 Tax=Hibiscus sabdariffa TaxID=183260 RepID=A0ABR2FYB3_9ROSI